MDKSRHITLAVAVLAVAILASLMFDGIWYDVDARGTYSGSIEREPTLWANYTIDSQTEEIQVEITNATPLIYYFSVRDTINSENKSLSNNDESSKEEFTSMDDIRVYVKWSAIFTIILFALGAIRRWFTLLSLGGWVLTLFLLVVMIPMSLMGGYSEGDPEAGGGLDTGEESGDEQFVHSTFDSSLGLKGTGIIFSFESNGYDLGLLDEDERDVVKESPPKEGEVGYDSLVVFSGEVKAAYGDGIVSWVASPLIPIVFFVIERVKRRFSGKDEIHLDDHLLDYKTSNEDE